MSVDGLEITLAVAAFLAGLTGTWSPCGFSMIATIGPAGHRSGRATTVASSLTFTAGALSGGTIIFGALATLGASVSTIEKPHGDHAPVTPATSAAAITTALST